jgi:hypothetical protein
MQTTIQQIQYHEIDGKPFILVQYHEAFAREGFPDDLFDNGQCPLWLWFEGDDTITTILYPGYRDLHNTIEDALSNIRDWLPCTGDANG